MLDYAQARIWLSEIFEDEVDEIYDATELEIEKAIDMYYDGGISAFILTQA